jgi:hypothetical protein
MFYYKWPQGSEETTPVFPGYFVTVPWLWRRLMKNQYIIDLISISDRTILKCRFGTNWQNLHCGQSWFKIQHLAT